jgi:hypothetical protein
MTRTAYPLARYDRQRLAVEARRDLRSVERVLRGLPVASTTFVSITEAAARLGLALPTPPTAHPEAA